MVKLAPFPSDVHAFINFMGTQSDRQLTRIIPMLSQPTDKFHINKGSTSWKIAAEAIRRNLGSSGLLTP